MKKALFAICSLMPGGFLLLGVMLLFIGCSHYQVRSAGFQAEGRTGVPGDIAVKFAVAEDIRAEAQMKNVCAANPAQCRAMELSVYGNYGNGPGYLDTPEGYTWAGIQAVQGHQQPVQQQLKPAVAVAKPTKKPKEALKMPQATASPTPQKPQRVKIPQWTE